MIGRGCFLATCLSVCALLSCAQEAGAQEPAEDREYDIKAAFLYNFGLYVQWPKNAVPRGDEQFVIGVVGKDPFGDRLDSIASAKKLDGKQIVIRRFQSVENYEPCHILFIAATPAEGSKEKTAEQRLAAMLRQVKGGNALLVSDSAGLAVKGSAINFFIDHNHVKFEINVEAAKKAGLKIKASLLKIGKTVPQE